MEDTRISDLAKAIMEATSVKEVIDSNGGHVNVGTNRFYLQVNDDVSIIKPLLCKTILAYIKCLAFSNTISYI